MNRYDIYDIEDCGDEILDPDGEWVKYEDHVAEIARLRAELDAAKAVIEKMSPDALALAAEWWRVEEMHKAGCKVLITVGNIDIVSWMNSCGRLGQALGPTPAAAIIAAHEAWQKEQGK